MCNNQQNKGSESPGTTTDELGRKFKPPVVTTLGPGRTEAQQESRSQGVVQLESRDRVRRPGPITDEPRGREPPPLAVTTLGPGQGRVQYEEKSPGVDSQKFKGQMEEIRLESKDPVQGPGPITDEPKGREPPPPAVTTLGPGPSVVQEESKWLPTNPERDLTKAEQRRVIAKAVKVAIMCVFSNHVYQFGGKKYKQVAGGPIGLRLTSLVARIVMDRWALAFLDKLAVAGMKIWAMVKYVDDVNVVVDMLDLGTKWVGNKLEKPGTEGGEEVSKGQGQGPGPITAEPRGRELPPLAVTTLGPGPGDLVSREKSTMKLVQEAANSVFPWLQFTTDVPEDHASGMVPMLDLQVWVEKTRGQTDRLAWLFFEKPSVSCRVLRAASAYSWRSKIVTRRPSGE